MGGIEKCRWKIMGQTSIDIDYQCPKGRGRSYNEAIVSK